MNAERVEQRTDVLRYFFRDRRRRAARHDYLRNFGAILEVERAHVPIGAATEDSIKDWDAIHLNEPAPNDRSAKDFLKSANPSSSGRCVEVGLGGGGRDCLPLLIYEASAHESASLKFSMLDGANLAIAGGRKFRPAKCAKLQTKALSWFGPFTFSLGQRVSICQRRKDCQCAHQAAPGTWGIRCEDHALF